MLSENLEQLWGVNMRQLWSRSRRQQLTDSHWDILHLKLSCFCPVEVNETLNFALKNTISIQTS